MFIEEAIRKVIEDGFSLTDQEIADSSIKKGMPHNQRAADKPFSNYSVYQKNDIFLEVCGQFENQRGLLGVATGLIPSITLLALAQWIVSDVISWVSGAREDGYWIKFNLFFLTGSTILWFLLVSWLFKTFALPVIRRDYFTSRRILIRFNRVTRKVYVHMPLESGGIQTYDWDTAYSTLDNPEAMSVAPVSKEEANLGDGRLVLGWVDLEARKMTGMFFVGRAAGNAERGRAWWEYIRRYMEEGPDTVPKPFPRLWKGPLPQYSLITIFHLYPERLRNGFPFWWLLLICIAPIDLLRAVLHWIAMLLCYEPKFPPEIENAGRSAR